MKASPTARSLKHLRDQGFTAQVVERWIPGANLRKDLFGGIDIVCVGGKDEIGPRFDTLGVQSTSDSNVSARREKMLAIPELRLWLECGNRLVIHGWAKKGPRGKPKRWALREVEIHLSDFTKVEVSSPAASAPSSS